MKQRIFLSAFIAATALSGTPAMAQVRFHGEASGASMSVMSWREIPFRTVVRQQHDYSCGSAALATLLTFHYGRPTTEPEAFKAMFARGDQAKIRKVGFSMLDMKRYLESRGLKADGFRMSLEEIAKSGAPVIALIDLGAYRHFVVIKGIQAGKVLVGDPALGLKTYSRSEFEKIWNGVVFGLHAAPNAATAAFNRPNEWLPWAVAPVGALPTTAMSALTNDQLNLYQISPFRALDNITAGGIP